MNCSLSLPSNCFQSSHPRRNHNISIHRKNLTLRPTKSFELLSPKCSLSSLSARLHRFESCSKLGTYISQESRALQFRANAQGRDESDLARERKMNFVDVLIKFSRPYTMIGTFVIFMGYLGRICMESSHLLKWSLLPKAMAILVALLSTSAYNSGLNQLCDVEIDRLNKPELALASGDLPIGPAWFLVASYLTIGILASMFVGSKVFMACICTKIIFGYMYNAPPIRLKKTSAGAVFTAMVGSLASNLAVFGCSRYILGLPFQMRLYFINMVHTSPVSFYMIFSTVFYATLAVLKDLYDVEGDSKYGIKTLAVTHGVRDTAHLGISILMVNYVFAIMQAIYNPQAFRGMVMIPAFTAMASTLAFRVWKLEKENYEKEASGAFYKFLWLLVDAAYVVFPFI